MDYARELTPCMHSRDRQTMQQMLMDNDTAQRQEQIPFSFHDFSITAMLLLEDKNCNLLPRESIKES